MLLAMLRKYSEDEMKLQTDYFALCKQYGNGNEELITYDNSRLDPKLRNQGKRNTSCREMKLNNSGNEPGGRYQFPVQAVFYNDPSRTILFCDNPEKQYSLPEIININYHKLFDSHKHSDVYNNVAVRVEDVVTDSTEIKIFTGRTTYFDSLVTNRAMDYQFENSLTVRRLFEYGNNISSLRQSRMSNHLGFNCMVETNDNKLVFVKRSARNSISKSTIGTGIGASLKIKYALEDGKVTNKGVVEGVKKEIKDELNLDEIHYHSISLKHNLIAFYRDLVEGGKPQLLFRVKLNISARETESFFLDAVEQDKKDIFHIRDGNKLIFIDKTSLKEAFIAPDGITVPAQQGIKQTGVFYRMAPSASASVAMYLSIA